MGLLRRDEPDQTPDEFWAEIEEKRGGKVEFFTFSKFIGRSRSDIVNLPGLVYIVKDVVHFEDFEKDNMMAKIIGRKRKYEKTEFSFLRTDIEEVQIVTQGNALKCITGVIGDAEVPKISGFVKLLSNPAYQVRLQNGESVFFEQVMDEQAFLAQLKK